jgi:hypothetical protein
MADVVAAPATTNATTDDDVNKTFCETSSLAVLGNPPVLVQDTRAAKMASVFQVFHCPMT